MDTKGFLYYLMTLAMYTLQTNVCTQSGYDEQQIAQVLLKGLSGHAADFLHAEATYNINALFIIAHAAIESAWGTSYLALNRNNLFGIAAYDTNPNAAYSFPSIQECINYYAHFLKTNYLTPGGVYYTGDTTIHNIFIHYSTSGDVEGQHIADIMNQLASMIADTKPVDVLSNEGHSTYTVVSGDSLSSIAARFNIPDWHTLYNFDTNRATIGNDPNLIRPGQVLHIPLGVDAQNKPTPIIPTPTPTGKTYTVKPGDSLWAIAQSQLGNGARWSEIASLNHIQGPKYIIYPNQVLTLPS